MTSFSNDGVRSAIPDYEGTSRDGLCDGGVERYKEVTTDSKPHVSPEEMQSPVCLLDERVQGNLPF